MTGEPRKTGKQGAGTSGPRWRALLEDRWQAHLQEVTELSLAYHVAAAAVPDGTGDGAGDCLSQGDRTADEKGEETVERNAESHWCASIFEFVVLNLVSFGCIFVSPRGSNPCLCEPLYPICLRYRIAGGERSKHAGPWDSASTDRIF